MKKRVWALLLALMFVLALAGCGEKDEGPRDASGKYKLSDGGEAIIDDVKSVTATEDNYRVFYEIFVGSSPTPTATAPGISGGSSTGWTT